MSALRELSHVRNTKPWKVDLPTYLPTRLPTYLPTYLPSYLPYYLPTYLPYYPEGCLPSHFYLSRSLSLVPFTN